MAEREGVGTELSTIQSTDQRCCSPPACHRGH
jgi:hypothetical protein